ncbi:MAG TPA: phosphatase PAP2 family protein [Nitrososphaeraceae archaeon]|nr:phosphatase PAP2 family protein [Nitrososphaeraceae archaeon]
MKFIIMSIICVTIFIIIGIMVSPKLGYQVPSVINFDESVSSLIYHSHYEPIDEFMILLSNYGREIVWLGVIVFMGIFAGWKGKKIAVIIIISFLIIIPLNIVFKNFFERNRPPVEKQEIYVPEKTDFAYPSGHASIVAAGAVILIILYRREKELIFSIVLAIEAALVCLSRIYVGDHYFLDVIGGALLGAGISFLTISLSKYIDPIMTRVRKRLQKEP